MESTPEAPRATYKDIAREIREDIANGVLRPGDRLPTGRDLAKRYGVTLMTVQNAYRQLREEGIVVAQQGRGTFVRDPAVPLGTEEGGSPAFAALASELTSIHESLRQLGERLDRLERLVERDGPQPS